MCFYYNMVITILIVTVNNELKNIKLYDSATIRHELSAYRGR